MGNRRITLLFSHIAPVLLLLAMTEFCWALAQSGQSGASANPGQGNTTTTTTTRTNNPDGSTTVSTTTTYKDGSTTTDTTYDKDGHDQGTVRTDVQTKDGETTTTITKYDGNGHEIGKTITRVDKDGDTTVTNYDGNGNPTGTTTLPPFKWKPDWKIGLDYKVPPELRYLPKPKSETQNSAPSPPGTTRVTNPDGTTTITTVTIFNDGWIITITKYDKDGHEAGTTRTDVQTKDGQTTTTTAKWDGDGHETSKTVEEAKQDGSRITITYDGNGHETGRMTSTSAQTFGPSNPSRQLPDLPKPMAERILQSLGKRRLNFPQSQQQVQGTSSVPPPMTASIVGVVTPTHRQNNRPFSGSITTDPKQYEGIPGLHVQEVKVPLVIGSDGKPTLRGLIVDPGGILQAEETTTLPLSAYGSEESFLLQSAIPPSTGNYYTGVAKVPSQPASPGISSSGGTIGSGPVPASGPTGAPQPPLIILHPNGNPPVSVTLDALEDWGFPSPYDMYPSLSYQDRVTFTPPSGEQRLAGEIKLQNLITDPICLPGHVTAVHGAGQFSGDAQKLHVSFNGAPVDPIAASTDGFFFQVPATAHEGPAQLVFVDQGPHGWFGASATIGVLQLHTGIANPNLHRGLHTSGTVGLSGSGYTGFKAPDTPQHLQNKVFYDPELVSLTDLQKQVPDFHPPETGQPGFILLSIQNRTPGIISIDGFKGNTRSWYLPADSLPFNTQLGIKAVADGGFDIGVIAQPLFPLLQVQEYQLPPELVHELEQRSGCRHTGPC